MLSKGRDNSIAKLLVVSRGESVQKRKKMLRLRDSLTVKDSQPPEPGGMRRGWLNPPQGRSLPNPDQVDVVDVVGVLPY